MKKEYAIYPFNEMRITQRHDEGNHLPHWKNSKDYSDKPWDEACKDGGRSYFVPGNDYIIEQVLGIDNSSTKGYTNSVRLRSVNKLYTAIKDEADYVYVTITHMNEDNLRQVANGQILKKGSKVILEGTDGQAFGNHFHCTVNFGPYYGCFKNSNDKWCYTYKKSLLPNEAFYLDSNHTKVFDSKGYEFKKVPEEQKLPILGTPVIRDTHNTQIEVLVDNLRVRDSANGNIKGYIKRGIYNVIAEQVDSYKWVKVDENLWIAYDPKWSNYYEKIVAIPESTPPVEEPETTPNTQDGAQEEPNTEEETKGNLIKEFIKALIKFFKKIFKV